MHEEQSEDVQKMGAVAPIGESYFDASALTFIKKRAPWLMILFVSGFFTTTAMKAFDAVLASIAQLAFYVPLLIAAGGNSGSQSSTLVIRALAVGRDPRPRIGGACCCARSAQGLVLGRMLAVFGVARVLVAGDGDADRGGDRADDHGHRADGLRGRRHDADHPHIGSESIRPPARRRSSPPWSTCSG